MRVYGAGGSIKSKWTKSYTPNLFNDKTVDAKFDLKISGYVF